MLPEAKETRTLLVIQDEFAEQYARHSFNPDNWQVIPHQINHVFQDWYSAWLEEHKHQNLGTDFTHSPLPEGVVRAMFGIFFDSLKQRNHVHVPEDVQKAAIQEYLED